MKSKIYITGSSGFIGFHIAKKLLDKGISVHGFDSMNNYYDINLKKLRLRILKKNKNFSFTKGLLENHKLLRQSVIKFKPTIFIHLAAQAGVRYSLKNPKSYLDNNIEGQMKLVDTRLSYSGVRHVSRRLTGNKTATGFIGIKDYSDKASIQKSVKLISSNETIYDSLVPDLREIWSIDGIDDSDYTLKIGHMHIAFHARTSRRFGPCIDITTNTASAYRSQYAHVFPEVTPSNSLSDFD